MAKRDEKKSVSEFFIPKKIDEKEKFSVVLLSCLPNRGDLEPPTTQRLGKNIFLQHASDDKF